jgi:RNA polymerase sigma-70 factor (ECF subfamily)
MTLLSPPRPARPARPTRGVPRWLEDPEVRLMLRAREGDADAFAQLVRAYSRRVVGYFCRHVGDRAEAEDLAQEVFLRLYRSRVRYQPKARFGTWVFHIMQNVARNAQRYRRRHPVVRLAPAGEGAGESYLYAAGDDPSRPLERAEVAEVVRAAVAGLASRQRAAVELHQFRDHTYAEVAAELDLTPKAAKSLLYRARNQLREGLRGYVQGEGAKG